MRELSQRDHGQGQDTHALAHDGFVRFVPPHHGLGPCDLQSHRSGSWHLRDMSQRHHGQGQDAYSLTDYGLMRFLPPHDRLDTGDVQP